MNSDNLILRQTDNEPLINKNDVITNAEFDQNIIKIYDDFVALNSVSDSTLTYNPSTTYTSGEYATYGGRLWIATTESTGVTPIIDGYDWIDAFPTILAHEKNKDTYLDYGGENATSVAEIRAFIDAGLTSTTNLNLTTKTSTSFKIESSTGADVIIPQANAREAGLLNSTDKIKLDNITGINTGDQTLTSLNAENVDNKVNDFTTIDSTTYPTTEAVDAYLTEQVPSLVEIFIDSSIEHNTNKAIDFTTVNDTLYPSVKAVDDHINSKLAGLWDDRGSYDASTNLFPSSDGSGGSGAIMKGDIWTINVQGTLGGTVMHVGDTVRALVDSPAQTSTNWALLENAIGYVPENVTNKVTTFAGNTSSDTKYPSVKAVVDNFDSTNIKSILGVTTLSGSNTGDQDLSNLVIKNASIIGATKTKITYDSKGLVTSGSDATTADIADSTNKRYVTDANLTVIGNTSGINTGDQTISDATISITDITTNNFSTTKHGFVPKGTNTGKYLKDDGTWSTIPTGGLTYFAEAQNTASPNATVPVDSLTAVSASTNADFAILPKGTGAFIVGHIPDGTYINGNKRGIYAVDIQPDSLAYANGATGTYSIAIGKENSATANGALALGYGARASGAFSTAMQNASTASGYGSVAIGSNSATATGTNSVSLGGGTASSNYSFCVNSTASGIYAVGLGNGNASTDYATAIGDGTKATGAYSMSILSFSDTFSHRSRLSYGAKNSGSTNPIGSIQGSTLVTSAETSGATPTTMTTFGALAIPLILQNNNSIRFKGTIIGRQSGSTNTSAWDIDGFIQRGANAGTTTLLISNINVVQNTPAWGTPTLTADTSNGGLDIKVIGAATTNIRWSCVLTTTEVIYA